MVVSCGISCCSGLPLTVARGLSECTACGTLGPQPGMEPRPPALQGRFFTTGPPGKSPFRCILPWVIKREEHCRAPPLPPMPAPGLMSTARVHACVISVKTEGRPPPLPTENSLSSPPLASAELSWRQILWGPSPVNTDFSFVPS